MPAFVDLTGRKFGHWCVLERASDVGSTKWKCICTCGTVRDVRSCHLVGGRTVSCGCYRKVKTAARNTKHGHAAIQSRTYITWKAMHQRCYNPKNPMYPRYGGKGIKVCQRWNLFENFYADKGDRPLGTSLDRYPDCNGDYEPDNTRWATPAEQRRNQKRVKLTLVHAREILRASKAGESVKSLATRFGTTPITVRKIRTGRTWKEAAVGLEEELSIAQQGLQ